MYLIIGNSAAALSAAEAIRMVDKDTAITMVCDEEGQAYSPVLLPSFIAGEIEKSKIYIKDNNFYKKNRIKTIFGKKAMRVLSNEKKLLLEDGILIKYNKLLIATGARPYFPEIKGINKEGVLGLRTKKDAIEIFERAKKAKHAVIFGGGLVSLKTAWAISKQNVKVSIIISSDKVLSQILDYEGASIIKDYLVRVGYRILTNSSIVEIIGNKEAEGVILNTGEKLPADLVVIGKGIKPNKELVEGTGIMTDKGIIVDEYMNTNKKDIYAAGDVAQANDILREGKHLNAIWPVAVAQGKTAGYNMAGKRRVFSGALSMNVVDLNGLTVASVGITDIAEDKECEEFIKRENRNYRKLIIKGDYIVGGVYIGNIENFGVIQSIIRKKIPLKRLPKPENILNGVSYGDLISKVSRLI